jgi:hypothetical protein
LIDIFSLPMAKPRGTIKPFQEKGKYRKGEKVGLSQQMPPKARLFCVAPNHGQNDA